MTGKYHAYILTIDGALKVRPAVASLDKEQSTGEKGNIWFVIRNLTDYAATVRFPSPRPRTRATAPVLRLRKVIAPHSIGRIRIKDSASGPYRYQVTFALRDGGHVHAAGESDPVVIVDP
jgi:hypothetical protein